jgi:hypothetical protein
MTVMRTLAISSLGLLLVACTGTINDPNKAAGPNGSSGSSGTPGGGTAGSAGGSGIGVTETAV